MRVLALQQKRRIRPISLIEPSFYLLSFRLAAAVLKCGERKVWMDPNEVTEIALANSRQNVRKLIKNGLIIRKPEAIHSRSRIQRRKEAKDRGNHTGICLPSFC